MWSYQSNARISDVEPLRNGNFAFVTTDNRVTEIDILGNRVGHWYAADRPQGEADGIPIPTLTVHHEVDELANGNLVVMGTEIREYDNWYTSETDPDAPREEKRVMGDVIVEFTRSGEVVWTWKALDRLDPYRIGYETFTTYWINRGFPGARDWSHGNGFFHDERDDSLLISFRMQDAVVKVDRKSGEIVWILGDHSGWPPHLQQKLITPEGEMSWFYHQHMPQVTADRTLLLFDNRTFSARPFAPPLRPAQTWTRAVEYAINEQTRSVRQLWASGWRYRPRHPHPRVHAHGPIRDCLGRRHLRSEREPGPLGHLRRSADRELPGRSGKLTDAPAGRPHRGPARMITLRSSPRPSRASRRVASARLRSATGRDPQDRPSCGLR